MAASPDAVVVIVSVLVQTPITTRPANTTPAHTPRSAASALELARAAPRLAPRATATNGTRTNSFAAAGRGCVGTARSPKPSEIVSNGFSPVGWRSRHTMSVVRTGPVSTSQAPMAGTKVRTAWFGASRI